MMFSYNEYQKLLNLSLENKVMRAEQLILKELKNSENPAIACSWGKDSTVLLHLVRKFCKNAIVSFNNTGIEYPETYAYRDLLLKEWEISNYVENKPEKSFWTCVKEYGYPKFRQMASQGKQRTPKCCLYLKERPARKFIKDYNVDCEFVGLQASESMVRRLSFLREGEVFNSKSYKCRLVRPLMIWTDKDVWEYHKLNNIPHNPLYDKVKRNGCMPCTGFKGWKEVLNNYNPKLYAYVTKQQGQPILSDCLKGLGSD